MYERAMLIGLYAETPLHPGTGQALGSVDLPVQRERHTGYPLIPGSSLKGVFRAFMERRGVNQDIVRALFGPETGRASEHAGALAFTDARLLLFPVRSLYGVFAWLTCPFVLERLRRDAAAAKVRLEVPQLSLQEGQARVAPGSEVAREGQAVLEEFAYEVREDPLVQELAQALGQLLPESDEYKPWRQRLPKHLVVLPDPDFADYVRFSTEVQARIALDDITKTTGGEQGNLWYEEQVPSEVLFYTLALASHPRVWVNGVKDAKEVLDRFREKAPDRVQVGGDETVGRGLVALRYLEGGG